MSNSSFFASALEIARMVNNVLELVNAGADEHVIKTHFESIEKIASATKPEIQGYSEHE
jgi:hypothetical protein